MWIGARDPAQPGLWYFDAGNPPSAFGDPQIPLGCQIDGSPVGLAYYAILSAGDVAAQAALANAMDRTAFPVEPVAEAPVTSTAPTGPRFSSCSVGYQSSGRLLTGMEGKTEPGATVALTIEVGTLLYDQLATTTAGDDGSFTLPDFALDDLTTPIPAGATITVVLTAGDNYPGACRIDVET